MLVYDADVRRQVEILTVDQFSFGIAQKARGSKPAVIKDRKLPDLWATAAAGARLGFAPTFLVREREHVILAQDLRTEQECLTCPRAGQGTPLVACTRAREHLYLSYSGTPSQFLQ